jgi:UDP-N-acetylmuramoylalanine--D-glutamate ligase
MRWSPSTASHPWPSPEQVLLLAPVCASFDQIKNYEQRGQAFKEIVRELG